MLLALESGEFLDNTLGSDPEIMRFYAKYVALVGVGLGSYLRSIISADLTINLRLTC